MVGDMLGLQSQSINQRFISYFEHDLAWSPCPHSWFRMSDSRDEGVEVPLLICSSKTDFVVSHIVMRRWSKFLKKGVCLWKCQDGRHFFYHFYPEKVGEKTLNFAISLPSSQAILNFRSRLLFFFQLIPKISVAKTTLIPVVQGNFCRPASIVLGQLPQFIPPILVGRVLRDGV